MSPMFLETTLPSGQRSLSETAILDRNRRLNDRWETSLAGGHVRASSDGERSLSWVNWPLFTVGMVQRGHSDETIQKILGLNVLRVWQANLTP